ncbi:S8 family serine peptidase [Fodinicola acaciae]|uniref:S8 family serine peptidase n=1 Tax=Fodinicola acaciae TaxID=2681555 RepID=UPI0013D465B9|nr:S8 family serine peptidase [Fodinicola acaciae]
MRRPLLAVFVALALAAGPLVAIPVEAAPPAPTAGPRDHGSLITLVTGDKVRLTSFPDGKQAAEAIPGPGRSRMAFQIRTVNGDTSVMPMDAVPLLAAGRLDSRLFNVSLLARDGYDDAHRGDIPLIETGAAGARTAAVAGSQVAAAYPRMGITVSRARKATAGSFWKNVRGGPKTLASGIRKLWLDGRTKASLDQSVPQIGAPEAWKAGYDGKDVPVAVLDTGLDAKHPDFATAVAASKDFSGSASGTDDKFGHGTHVASTVAGSGAASGGKYKGVAPGAKLLIGKVLADDGYGDESWIVAGMQWAVEQHARVVSMSLGTEDASDGTDPISQAVNTLTAQSGALFVAASGNNGEYGVQVGSPAAADAALAVAAVTKQDQYAAFSNPGPRLNDYATKPDISAPGVAIVAARAAGTSIGEPVGDNYTRLSGTSMATPHVAGSAAILAQEHPTWKADQLRAALMSTSKQLDGATALQQGAGRVDVARAFRQKVTGTGSLSYGIFQWPHTGQKPGVKTVTYANDGDSPVTLALTHTLAAGFSLSANSVTVPAHGTAAVEATFDPAKAALGQRSGWIIATAGDTVVRTAVGAYNETERYNLTVTSVGRDGKPNIYGGVDVYNRATKAVTTAGFDANGVAKLRLDAGKLAVSYSGAQLAGDAVTAMTVMSASDVDLGKDVSLTFDARTAKAAPIKVDQPDATGARQLGWFMSGKGPVNYGFNGDAGIPWYTGSTGHRASDYQTYDLSSLTRPDALVTGFGAGKLALGYLATSKRGTGVSTPTLVDGGTGSPADLSKVDVKGKIVVAVPTDNDPGLVPDAVAQAGGVGVIIGEYFLPPAYGAISIPGYHVESSALQPLLAALKNGPTKVNLDTVASSPYRYDLLFQDTGGFPDGKPRQVDRRQLAHTRATYRQTGTAGTSHGMAPYFVRVGTGFATTRTPRVALPSTQDQYVTPGPVNWLKEASTGDFFDTVNGSYGFASTQGRTYRVGHNPDETWNSAVYAPRVSTADPLGNGEPFAYRNADTIAVALPLLTESGADLQGGGCYRGAPENTKLLRDGQPVSGDIRCVGNGEWTVPPGDATYQLSAHQPAPPLPGVPLSSDVSATWTFRSSHVDGAAKKPLPLLDVRYAPQADGQNRVPATTVVPLTIGRQAGSGSSAVASVQAWVSLDDGKTWKSEAAHGVGSTWFLPVIGGKSGGFVSLRVKATDTAGNSVDETILRAYEVR